MNARIIASSIALAASSHVSFAATFFDDFNRSDSPNVGNGWFTMNQSVPGPQLQIANDQLTLLSPRPMAGVFRPFLLSGSVEVGVAMTETSGFDGLARRYDQYVWVFNDGTIGDGYGLNIIRGDQNYSDSRVTLTDGAATIGTLNSTFQFGPQIYLDATFNLDGSVTGTLSQPGASFTFSFGPHAIQSVGGSFAIAMSGPDGRSSSFIYPTMDNVSIASVPELSTFGMLLMGLLGIGSVGCYNKGNAFSTKART